MDYQELKALAKTLQRPVTSLIALAPQNDPFYVGTENDLKLGQWFAQLWRRFRYSNGVHLRRMHYAIVSQNPPVIMPNGKAYENTLECWGILNAASTRARYLDLVAPAAFVDRRNGEPLDHADYEREHVAEVKLPGDDEEEEEELSLPDFPDPPAYDLAQFDSPQRYHLEIWCEKSTMNDILGRLAWVYGAVVQYGMGELSITVAVEAVKRFKRADKPARIFYVSDFDPAGAGMPVSMSRKLEYFLRKMELDIDVKLFPVVLTHEQVKHYTKLLPTPIKESERRKASFEARYGEGAVELDALEALYPGELEKILREELGRYYDYDLAQRVADARDETSENLVKAQERVYEEFQDDLDALNAEYEEITEEISQRLEHIHERQKELWQAIRDRLEEEQPYVSDEDVPEAATAEERDGALYDSARDYIEQNDTYQVYKGKETYQEEESA